MDVNIHNFLNIRNTTRKLNDVEFESVVSTLASQLENISFIPKYSDQQLRTDWNNLCKWTLSKNHINSTSRIGMKFCEHYFPNFYDIENSKGKSFSNSWTADNLKKILRWNRKSHSTPYLSEIKRGIYFCCGLTKNTMYRPQMAKLLCIQYKPKVVFDPCAGWGGRMLGVVSSGANYIAFEPNTKTYKGLMEIVEFLNIQDKVTLICDDALRMNDYNLPKVDMILTSPPYFDVEVYCKENTQSITNISDYDGWVNSFLEPLIVNSLSYLNDGGVTCWNVGKVGKRDMKDDVERILKEKQYFLSEVFSVLSSKRQALQDTSKNLKSADTTEVYKIMESK
jgi:16S rRNA G966 N2-methylase RsmD